MPGSFELTRVTRWLVIGVVFTFIGTPLLYLLHGVARLDLLVASLLVGELTTLPRFFINDRVVFGHRRPTWQRLWQYHVACVGGFAVWWGVTNLLPHFGVQYIIASLFATGCSVGLSLLTNFSWIWRHGAPVPAEVPIPLLESD